MMMTIDQSASSGFADFSAFSSNSPPIINDSDVDWTVFDNAERFLLRDDSAWITRLSKDFWWNLERISEMITLEFTSGQQINRSNFSTQKFAQQTKNFPQQTTNSIQFGAVPPRKIVGLRSQQTNKSMFNNGFSSPPSSSGSTIVRPTNNFNIPEKSNFFQTFSSMSIVSGNNDQDIEYNPFQSKISFDNNMWGNNSQQPIPWQ